MSNVVRSSAVRPSLTLTDLTGRLADTGWELARVLPRDREHALLEMRDGAGRPVPGQWFADPERARRVAVQTSGSVWGDPVEQPLADVVAQHGGADRRLRGLASRCAEPGTRLRAHRPERRAVVEVHAEGRTSFVKFVRPERLRADQLRAMTLSLDGVPIPRVTDVDQATGTVTTAALAGPTLHEALRSGAPELDEVIREVGQVLARLHASAVPAGVAHHNLRAELAVVDHWWGLAKEFGAGAAPDPLVRAERARLRELMRGSRAPRRLLHRDLHDKQVIVGTAGPGLLDLDLLAAGDPALDLANLAIHLELRARQGLLSIPRAVELTEHLVAGYAPDGRTRRAGEAYLLATRLRLVAVYAFRPGSAEAAAQLITDPVVTSFAD